MKKAPGCGKLLSHSQKSKKRNRKKQLLKTTRMNNFFRVAYYGDYGDSEASKGSAGPAPQDNKDWPLWEVFIRSKQGLEHKHVGSMNAADAQMAIENARDVYTRRQEGISIIVVLFAL